MDKDCKLLAGVTTGPQGDENPYLLRIPPLGIPQPSATTVLNMKSNQD